MFRTVRALVLALFLACTGLVVVQAPAHACKCDLPAVGKAARQADVVFSGVMLGEQRGNLRSTLAFEVEEVFKGEVTESPLDVASPTDSCGLRLTEDQTYLVFARDGGTGLASEQCYGTTRARTRTIDALERNVGPGRPFEEPAAEPPAPTYTRVLETEPPQFTRMAAPGAALALVGLLGWFLVRRRS